MKEDKTETTIMSVLEYMKSLPHQQAIAFAEEIIYAVAAESGNRIESLGILRWVEDTIICECKQVVETKRDLYVDKAIVGN